MAARLGSEPSTLGSESEEVFSDVKSYCDDYGVVGAVKPIEPYMYEHEMERGKKIDNETPGVHNNQGRPEERVGNHN